MLIHPTVERLRALGLTAMAMPSSSCTTFPMPANSAARIGSGCLSTVKRPAARTSGSLAACARPGYAAIKAFPPLSLSALTGSTRQNVGYGSLVVHRRAPGPFVIKSVSS